jgi:polar amino acid transport system substrate-binding protein
LTESLPHRANFLLDTCRKENLASEQLEGTKVAVETLRSGNADVFASSAQFAHAVAAGLPSAKIIPGAFLSVRMAVALPKGRSSVAQSKLAEIINEAKRTGIVQRAIDESGLQGVRAALN